MYNDMVSYGLDSNYSSLYPRVGDNLPDDSFSNIPYEKGFQLLYYMESLIGADNMQKLIREWIDEQKQKSATFIMFQQKFQSFLQDNYEPDQA